MAPFHSSRGSIADRMKSLKVRSTLIRKQGPADAGAAMAAADPTTPPGAGLANTQPVQDLAAQSLVPDVVPPQAAGKRYYDDILSAAGGLGDLIGQRPGHIAQWYKNGMPGNSIKQFDMGMALAAELSTQVMDLLGGLQSDPQFMQMLEYDSPIQAPDMTNAANPNEPLPPVTGAEELRMPPAMMSEGGGMPL